MEYLKNTYGSKGKLLFKVGLGLLVLTLFWGGNTAMAQVKPFDPMDERTDADITTGLVTGNIALEDLPSVDLTNMSRAWWKAIRQDHIQLLHSSEDALKEQALQNIIFFAKIYRKQVDLTKAVPQLYKIYQRDTNEDHRVMALSALGLIGNRNIMIQLREDVKEEESERVRRHTLYLLADYYKNQAR